MRVVFICEHGATYVFVMGCALPERAQALGKAADWSDVPDDQGYASMRDAIVRHVTALLDALQRLAEPNKSEEPSRALIRELAEGIERASCSAICRGKSIRDAEMQPLG